VHNIDTQLQPNRKGTLAMFSVALIGPDGAGKTTIARMLEARAPLPMKYIYMGVNIAASNFALPTSRFVEYLRGQSVEESGASQKESSPSKQTNRKSRSLGNLFWSAGRLANWLADEWYRQLWSWAYQSCGYIALYDRHYLFDFTLENVDIEHEGFDTRLHRWFLTHLYPRPSLVIFLDAPSTVLFARKGEKDLENLEARRRAFAQQMDTDPSCVVIDATQPLARVYEEVADHIRQAYTRRKELTRSVPAPRPPAAPPVPPDRDSISEPMR
jgi:thymidylate kinase